MMLFQDFVNDPARPQHVLACAAAACGADDDRDAGLRAGGDHEREVLFAGLGADDGCAQAQLVRPGIGGTRVHHDGVRVHLHAPAEGFLREAVAQHAARRQDFKWFHAGLLFCYRS